MRLFALFVVVTADPARRALGKRKQGAKALAAMTKECRAVLSENNLDWLLEPFTCSARMRHWSISTNWQRLSRPLRGQPRRMLQAVFRLPAQSWDADISHISLA